MSALLTSEFGEVNPRKGRAGLWIRAVTLTCIVVLTTLLGGCAVMWVADYDKDSVARTTEISKSVLKVYQDLLSTEVSKRGAAMAGPMAARHGETESLIRVHLLREQARAKNAESTTIVGNLLEAWQKFSANHRSADATALNDVVLGIERGILERHLRAAFVAEEAKKLGGGAR